MRQTTQAMEPDLSASTPPPPQVQFTTVDRLFQDIDKVSGDTIHAHGVSIEDFTRINEARRRKFRFRRFYAARRLLIIAIPTTTHEVLQATLYDETIASILGMDLRMHWGTYGATLHRAANGDAAEADSSGVPALQRPGPNPWPSLVIEAGHMQSLQAMRNDMRWWFTASDHQVKIVLLAKVEIAQRLVILEKYQEAADVSAQRPGAASTRASSAVRPYLDQAVHIAWAAGTTEIFDKSSFRITSRGSPLRLDFEQLFQREPAGPGEHDIVIRIEELQIYAWKVWRTVQ